MKKVSVLGRPSLETDITYMKMLLSSSTKTSVCQSLDISRGTLYRRLKDVDDLKEIHSKLLFEKHQRWVRNLAHQSSIIERRGLIPNVPLGRVPLNIDLGIVRSSLYRMPISQIAKQLHIGRVTLYRYISNLDWYVAFRRERSVRRNKLRIVPLTTYYPYVVSNDADGTELVGYVNSLVPKYLPEALRADVCQEMILAVLSGEVEASNLSGYVRQYIKEQGQFLPQYRREAALDAPMYFNGAGTSYTLLDVISMDKYIEAMSNVRAKNCYSSLSNYEDINDMVNSLRSGWEANRMTTARRNYGGFSKRDGVT